MKHAYLIIAHNEFDVLEKLVHALDDDRNDIFLHIDKKVRILPNVTTQKANLFFVANRIDVRWGHVSQLIATYALFEAAIAKGSYSYCHIISGVHFPLHSQDYIHSFFKAAKGKSILQKMETSEEEINLKLRKYHFFLKHFISSSKVQQRCVQFCWLLAIKIQKWFSIVIFKDERFIKASQWASLSGEAVAELVRVKQSILKKYRYSFCADEFFVASTLEDSGLAGAIIYNDYLLKCDFIGTSPRNYELSDFEELISSDYLFARKFSSRDLVVVNKILSEITVV